MYKILGGDGKEYGPVTAEALRQWITENRANAQTQVQAEGSTDWVALGDVPEFADALRPRLRLAATEPGVPSGSTPAAFSTTPTSAAGYTPAAYASTTEATALVSGPATGLLVTAILGILAQLAAILINVFNVGSGALGGMNSSNMAPPAWVNMMSGTVGVISAIFGLAMSGFIIYGAQKMKRLESYGLVLAASIVAAVPCVSPCCLVGLPIGIWAIVVLNKPEVKGAFH